MATGGLESFLRAEEEANRLVEELRRLKKETDSYKTAREALGQAAASVGELATRGAKIAERLGGLAETLRSIGTPELLRGLEGVASELGMLRQDLDGTGKDVSRRLKSTSDTLSNALERMGKAQETQLEGMTKQLKEAHQRDIDRIKEDLGAQLVGTRAALRAVRNLTLGSVALLVIALAILALLLARG